MRSRKGRSRVILRGRIDREALPTLAFLAAVVLALGIFEWYARSFWFVGDEWDFLATNRLAGVDGEAFWRLVLRPHNEHWSTLPRLWYWAADSQFGLRSYTPYVTAVILLHLGLAVLLWMLLRRLGVQPWIAAGFGSIFALFGPGAENIFWGFQVGFVGSALFGLAAILLADHDGHDRRRDVLAGFSGLAALLCSGIGIPFAVGLGVAICFRRGIRSAAVIVAPLALVFLAWYVAFGRANEANTVPRSGPSQWPPYIFEQTTNALEQVSQLPMVGGVVLALVLAWVGYRIRRDYAVNPRLAPLYGLLGTAVVLSLTTALGRASLGVDQARASRYVYLLAVMLIPVLAAMLDSALRRDRRASVPIAIFMVIAIVGCVTAIPRYAFAQGQLVMVQRNALLAAISDPLTAKHAADSFLPYPQLSPDVTLGALRARAAAGDLPKWIPSDAERAAARAATLIGVAPAEGTSGLEPARVEVEGAAVQAAADGCLVIVAASSAALARVAIGPESGVVVTVAPDNLASADVAFDADPTVPVPIAASGPQPIAVTTSLPAKLALRLARAGATTTVCATP